MWVVIRGPRNARGAEGIRRRMNTTDRDANESNYGMNTRKFLLSVCAALVLLFLAALFWVGTHQGSALWGGDASEAEFGDNTGVKWPDCIAGARRERTSASPTGGSETQMRGTTEKAYRFITL
ncbi:MAG: hypothetical protein NVSMB62_02930 [Acidobacteriaceae bacterium]